LYILNLCTFTKKADPEKKGLENSFKMAVEFQEFWYIILPAYGREVPKHVERLI